MFIKGIMSSVFDKPVEEIMSSPVITVNFSDPALEAARKMIAHDIGAVIVVSGGLPVGIITEKDILRKIVLEERNPRTTRCEEIMSKPLITVKPETKLGDALHIMREKNIRRLPVQRGNKLVGIVTAKDIIGKII